MCKDVSRDAEKATPFEVLRSQSVPAISQGNWSFVGGFYEVSVDLSSVLAILCDLLVNCDCSRFWIEEFTHNNKDKPLASKYRYQIEFNYGRRGSRIDIAPPTCTELISMNSPGFQQCYGCPYKFLESTDLKATLAANGLNSIQVDEVLAHVDKNDYQLACTKYFESTIAQMVSCKNDYKTSEVINSPNRYFDLCQMIKRTANKHTQMDAGKNDSVNSLLYDKHLWEMLSPTKDQSEAKTTAITVDNVEPMSQFDFNY